MTFLIVNFQLVYFITDLTIGSNAEIKCNEGYVLRTSGKKPVKEAEVVCKIGEQTHWGVEDSDQPVVCSEGKLEIYEFIHNT